MKNILEVSFLTESPTIQVYPPPRYRNFGHQAAITVGMNVSSGDVIVDIDADLQDPPEVIIDMIQKWKQGYDVVYGGIWMKI